MKDNTDQLLSGSSGQLSAAEEVRLFNRYRSATKVEDELGAKAQRSSKERSQLGIARKQATQLRERLITANLHLAVFMAKRFNSYNLGIDELTTICTETLLRSVELFSPAKGYKFSTYASRAMFNACVRANSREQKHHQARAPEEAAEWEITRTKQTTDLGLDIQKMLDENWANLTDLEACIIRHNFGIGKADEKTLGQIAPIVGLTKGRVQQIHAQAIAKLKAVLQDIDI